MCGTFQQSKFTLDRIYPSTVVPPYGAGFDGFFSFLTFLMKVTKFNPRIMAEAGKKSEMVPALALFLEDNHRIARSGAQ